MAAREVGDAGWGDQQSIGGRGGIPARFSHAVLTEVAVQITQVAVSHVIHDDANQPERWRHPVIGVTQPGFPRKETSSSAADRVFPGAVALAPPPAAHAARVRLPVREADSRSRRRGRAAGTLARTIRMSPVSST